MQEHHLYAYELHDVNFRLFFQKAFWIFMKKCGEIIGFQLLSCQYMTQTSASRGRKKAMRVTRPGQWGYTTIAGGLFWVNGMKNVKTIAWCQLATAVGTRFARFLAVSLDLSFYSASGKFRAQCRTPPPVTASDRSESASGPLISIFFVRTQNPPLPTRTGFDDFRQGYLSNLPMHHALFLPYNYSDPSPPIFPCFDLLQLDGFTCVVLNACLPLGALRCLCYSKSPGPLFWALILRRIGTREFCHQASSDSRSWFAVVGEKVIRPKLRGPLACLRVPQTAVLSFDLAQDLAQDR